MNQQPAKSEILNNVLFPGANLIKRLHDSKLIHGDLRNKASMMLQSNDFVDGMTAKVVQATTDVNVLSITQAIRSVSRSPTLAKASSSLVGRGSSTASFSLIHQPACVHVTYRFLYFLPTVFSSCRLHLGIKKTRSLVRARIDFSARQFSLLPNLISLVTLSSEFARDMITLLVLCCWCCWSFFYF